MASSVSGIRAGKAYIEMGLNDAALIKGLRKTEASLKSWGKGIAGVGAALGGMGAAITAPITAAAASFAAAGSALWDMSGRTGASVEALSALGYAADQTGSDLETVEGGIKKMQKALVAGSEENLTAQATFEALGLSVEKLMRLSPEQQFQAIAKAISGVHNPAAKAAAAMAVFGKSGTSLIPLLDDLPALTSKARELGLVMSTEDAAAADALGDAMDTVVAVAKRAVVAVGGALAPALTALSGAIATNVASVVLWIQENQPLIRTVFQIGVGLTLAGAAFVALGTIISGAGAALGAVAGTIVTFGAVLGAILSPLGLVVAGVAGLVYWSGAGGAALAWLGESFAGLATIATDTFKGISDAMTAGDIALAGQILWAGLRVQWLKGTNFLRQIWSDWGVWFVDSFASWQYAIAGFMTDMWDGVRVIWAQAMSDLFGSWGSLVSRMIRTFLPFSGILADIFGIDIEKSVNDALAALGVSGTDTTEQKKALDAEVARIGQENIGKRKVLSDQQAAEAEARRRAADAGLEAGKAELTQAQEDLQSYLSTAKSEAGTVSGKLAGGKPAMPEFSPDSLDAGLQQAAAKVDVKGSFSASALAGLGAGDTANDQLKEQKTSNKHLAKIAKKIDDAELAFS